MSSDAEIIEQLRRELDKAHKAIRIKDEKLDRQERALKKREREIEKNKRLIEEQAAQIQARDEQLRALATIGETIFKYTKELIDAELLREGKDPISDGDRLEWLFKRGAEDLEELIGRAKNFELLKFIMAKGPEKLDESRAKSALKKVEEAKKALVVTDVSVKRNERRNGVVQGMLRDVSNEMNDAGQSTPITDAFVAASELSKKLAETKSNEQSAQPPVGPQSGVSAKELIQKADDAAQAKLKEKDRSEDQGKVIRTIPSGEISGICPGCGKEQAFVRVAETQKFIRFMTEKMSELLEEGVFSRAVMKCPACGCVFPEEAPDMPVPFSPTSNARVDSTTVITLLNLAACGISINKAQDVLNVYGRKIASEGVARALDAWISNGIGRRLLDAHRYAVRNAQTIYMDETKIDVLSRRTAGVKPETHDDSQSSYLSCISGYRSAGDREPFAVYDLLEGRSGEEILRVLSDWEFEALGTDGYKGYDKALRAPRFVNVKHQSCLIHFRRTLYKCINVPEYNGLVTHPDRDKLIREKLRGSNPETVFLAVLGALTVIYQNEQLLKRRDNESTDDFLERVRVARKKYAEPMMEQIDSLMKEMAKTYATESSKGRWQEAGCSPFAAGVVYWMNNRAKLMQFVTEPNLKPDTNNTERAIRAITLYRNNSNFFQTTEGAKAFCGMLSLRETGKLNGIADVVTWLDNFHRAFLAHIQRVCWTEREQRRDPLKPDAPRSLYIQEITDDMVKGFDFEPWLAWNYAAKN